MSTITQPSPAPDAKEFLSRAELMELLGVSKWWTQQAMAAGMPHLKRGQLLRFHRPAVLAWLAAGDESAA